MTPLFVERPPLILSALPGDLAYIPSDMIPRGWLRCDEDKYYPIDRYRELYKAIGFSHGMSPDGLSFKIPDIIDFIRVLNPDADGVDAGRIPFSRQMDSLGKHSHYGGASTINGGHSHSFTLTGHQGMSGGPGGDLPGAPAQGSTVAWVKTANSNDAGDHMHGATVYDAGSDETAPANITMVLCIYSGYTGD